MKHKAKLSKKTIRLISIISVFAMLIGIATPLTANFIAKENAETANVAERATSTVIAPHEPYNGFTALSFYGCSCSEDVSGLAFAFKLKFIFGIDVDKNSNEFIYDNATALYDEKYYPLLGMGAIVHNKEAGKLYTIEDCDGQRILNIPAKYALRYNETNQSGEYAVRIIDMPQSAYDIHLTAIPYYTINMDGKIINVMVHEALETRTFNETNEGKDNQMCEATQCIFDIAHGDDYLWVEDGAREFGSDGRYKMVKIPNKAGNIINEDGYKVDVDENGTITIQIDCVYHGKTHTQIIPKECRYHN